MPQQKRDFSKTTVTVWDVSRQTTIMTGMPTFTSPISVETSSIGITATVPSRTLRHNAGVGDGNWSVSASFGDFNLDGHLDLYIANYLDYPLETAHACFLEGVHIYCGPHEYPGARDTLYRNNGDGTFTDVTTRDGGSQHR